MIANQYWLPFLRSKILQNQDILIAELYKIKSERKYIICLLTCMTVTMRLQIYIS